MCFTSCETCRKGDGYVLGKFGVEKTGPLYRLPGGAVMKCRPLYRLPGGAVVKRRPLYQQGWAVRALGWYSRGLFSARVVRRPGFLGAPRCGVVQGTAFLGVPHRKPVQGAAFPDAPHRRPVQGVAFLGRGSLNLVQTPAFLDRGSLNLVQTPDFLDAPQDVSAAAPSAVPPCREERQPAALPRFSSPRCKPETKARYDDGINRALVLGRGPRHEHRLPGP